MMSSRWPRPMGIIASMALMPVCSGSLTGWRSTTPGALNSMGRKSVVSIGPLSSSGLPSGSTTRPTRASPTGTCRTLPGALDEVALFDERVLAQQHRADVVFFEVQRQAGHAVGQVEHLHGQGVAQAVDAGDAVADLEDGADLLDLDLGLVVLDLASQDRGDLFGTKLHLSPPLTSAVLNLPSSCWMRARRLPSTRRSSTRSTSPPRMSGSTRFGQSRLAAGRAPHPVDDEALDLGADGHGRGDLDLDHPGRPARRSARTGRRPRRRACSGPSRASRSTHPAASGVAPPHETGDDTRCLASGSTCGLKTHVGQRLRLVERRRRRRAGRRRSGSTVSAAVAASNSAVA